MKSRKTQTGMLGKKNLVRKTSNLEKQKQLRIEIKLSEKIDGFITIKSKKVQDKSQNIFNLLKSN